MTDINDNKKTHVLLAAGGSGGHLFPAMALAKQLMKEGCDVRILTDHRGARFKGEDTPYPIDIINSATLGGGLIGKIKTIFHLGLGVLQSAKIIKKFKPDVVVGFGGYPAFPPLLAAQKMNVPTILHEANAILGKANQMLAKGATKLALSLPATKGMDVLQDKCVVTGLPIRDEIIAAQNTPYPKLDDKSDLNIFIMGGSQGASIFSDVLPDAISMLPEHIQARLNIVQHCREEDLQRTEEAYKKTKATATLKTFFDDVPDQLKACHLFIGRSGASSVSEVAIVGRPAIFVPMNHADMQQKVNADVVADVGGGWVMLQDGFTAKALSTRLETLIVQPDTFKTAATKSASVGQPNATKNLAKLVKSLA